MPQQFEKGFRSPRHMLFRPLLPKISSIVYWARVGRPRYLTLNIAGLSQHPLQMCDMLHRHVSDRVWCEGLLHPIGESEGKADNLASPR